MLSTLLGPALLTLAPALATTGGSTPGGPFDLVITAGTLVVIDTTFSIVVDPLGNQTVVRNGDLRVHDLVVEPGATLQLRGPNPLFVRATGEVRILGLVCLDGFDAKDVAGIFTASFPEPGAAGNLGGGRGGNASVQTTQSTPQGSTGFGAFGLPAIGGRGGETGYGGTQNSDPDVRRGAGGGGGAFGRDASADVPASFSQVGLVAQPGGPGSPLAAGAIHGGVPAGGAPGLSVFGDGDRRNDFWGFGWDGATGRLIEGELPTLWAGGGGGGGGDSTRSATFPHPSFTNQTEDKGGAGGGGAGGLYVGARGPISLVDRATGLHGRITANGGRGARGQLVVFNANFFVPSGSGGGGGSGGHIVLDSQAYIDLGASPEVLQARGGAGGQASGQNGEGRGGDGGPGVIQLHVPFADPTLVRHALPLNEASVPPPHVLLNNPLARRP